MQMTQQNYKQQWSKIANYEKLGTIFCFGMALYLIVNFEKLNSTPLLVCGIFSLFTLIILPIISLKLVKNVQSINLINTN